MDPVSLAVAAYHGLALLIGLGKEAAKHVDLSPRTPPAECRVYDPDALQDVPCATPTPDTSPPPRP